MELKKLELTVEELQEVGGGAPPLAVVGAATAYIWVLDQAWSFGEGLGYGLYDAIHRK